LVETILIAFLLLSNCSLRDVLRIDPEPETDPFEEFLDLPSLLFLLNRFVKPDGSAFNPIPKPTFEEIEEVEPFLLCLLLGRAYGSEA